MIGLLEFLGAALGMGALCVVGAMVFALVVLLLGSALLDARSFLRERHYAMLKKKTELQRDAAHNRDLAEQLHTARTDVARLTYENETLVRRLNAAGIVALPTGSGQDQGEARHVVGIVEERRP